MSYYVPPGKFLRYPLRLEPSESLTEGLVGVFPLWALRAQRPLDVTRLTRPELLASSGTITRTPGLEDRFSYRGTGGTNLDRINLGNIAANHPLSLAGSTNYSIAWVGEMDLAPFGRVIDKSTAGSWTNGWGLNTGNNNTEMQCGANGQSSATYYFSSGTGYILITGVHRYAFTRAGTRGEYWRDGLRYTVDNKPSATIPTTAAANAALMHWNHNTTDRHYRGYLESVYVWDRTLTSRELRRFGRLGDEILFRRPDILPISTEAAPTPAFKPWYFASQGVAA